MPKAKSIPPFCNEASSASPPFPSMLTDQLELFGNAPCSLSLLSDEIIPPKFKIATNKQRASSERPSESKFVSSKLQVTKKGRRVSREASECPSEALSDLSTLSESSGATSDSDSTSSTLSDSVKIPKPPGEPGRPGRGGYNLETALDWNSKVYSKFKKLTYKLIDEHLDTTKCTSAQNPTSLKDVHDKAREAFPDLDNYHNCWPVTDVIMMRLKYTSSRARRHALDVTAGKAKHTGKTAK